MPEVVRKAIFAWENRVFVCDCQHECHVRFLREDVRDASARFRETMGGGYEIRKACPECHKQTTRWREVKDE